MFVEKLINKQKNIKYLIVKNNSVQSKLLQFLLAYKSEKQDKFLSCNTIYLTCNLNKRNKLCFYVNF